jgi:hypothetical protein
LGCRDFSTNYSHEIIGFFLVKKLLDGIICRVLAERRVEKQAAGSFD